MSKCHWADGTEIRLGDNEVDPCLYEEIETVEHCTVHILQCSKCGHIEILWEREKDEN